jgi:hypothetical protein
MAHQIFISHASEDWDEYTEAFIAELTRRLQGSLGVPADEVCFVDKPDLSPGGQWEADLFDQANGARVLICLISPRYFTREWCGKELEVFLRRVDLLRKSAAHPTPHDLHIIPVVWHQPWRMPRVLKHIQSTHRWNQGSESICLHDVFSLQAERNRQELLGQAISRLINDIITKGNYLEPDLSIADWSAVTNAFDREYEPMEVTVLNYLPVDPNMNQMQAVRLRTAANSCAMRLQRFVRMLDMVQCLNPDARIEQLRTAEQILVAVIPYSLTAADLAALDVITSGYLLFGLVAITGSHRADWATLNASTFTGGIGTARDAGFCRTATAGFLDNTLKCLVDDIRATHLRSKIAATPATVRNAHAEMIAQNAGLDPMAKPILTGPGKEGS